MTKVILALLFALFATILTSSHVVNAQPTAISLGDQKVIYELPYAGILPDHPLYFFKRTRDRVVEFLTRDNLKKAEYYLLQSDKHLVMSTQLADKSKHELATTTLKTGEQYFEKILPVLRTSKKQGVRPTDDLMRKIQNSNIKHREVIEELMRDLPQGSSDELATVLEMNKNIYNEIERTK